MCNGFIQMSVVQTGYTHLVFSHLNHTNQRIHVHTFVAGFILSFSFYLQNKYISLFYFFFKAGILSSHSTKTNFHFKSAAHSNLSLHFINHNEKLV
jgi:hypothetical protein